MDENLTSLLVDENHPALREVAKPVKEITADTLRILNDMRDMCKEHKGLGLAAPQIGVSLRLILVDGIAMINPEIVHEYRITKTTDEECLSLPGQVFKVTRPMSVKVSWTNEQGKKRVRGMRDLLSICVQHEIDHLDGVLISDKGTKVEKGETDV